MTGILAPPVNHNTPQVSYSYTRSINSAPSDWREGKGSQPEQETESISFKGTASEDASWLENADNVQIFPFAGFVQLLYQYVCDRRTILIRI